MSSRRGLLLIRALLLGVSALLVGGCGGQQADEALPHMGIPREVQTREQIGAAARRAEVPPTADLAYSLPLDESAQAEIFRTNGIQSVTISDGAMEIKTDSIDGHFSLFPGRQMGRLKPPLWLEVEMGNAVPGAVGMIYWDTGSGFNEKERVSWKLLGDGAVRRYVLRIDAPENVLNIRFDPSQQPDTVKIRRLHVYSEG